MRMEGSLRQASGWTPRTQGSQRSSFKCTQWKKKHASWNAQHFGKPIPVSGLTILSRTAFESWGWIFPSQRWYCRMMWNCWKPPFLQCEWVQRGCPATLQRSCSRCAEEMGEKSRDACKLPRSQWVGQILSSQINPRVIQNGQGTHALQLEFFDPYREWRI